MNIPDRPLLALDIGTRKVAGAVVVPSGRGLRVLAATLIEHPDRAMLDGQVHKVEAVAEVVARVRAELEAAVGHPLAAAAVAAAGRALLTENGRQVRTHPHPVEVVRPDILALELAAVRSAQSALRQRSAEHAGLYCVGYSTVRYTLDGQTLDDLVGHRGREVAVDVLATFLPRQVVDSLLTVLRRTGLTAVSLTLEPIAALEATIPPDLRRMNLALVDVGAGTSDIALTRDGSVFAYAMVTQAGDEITERLCDHFLLEFAEGERVKRLLEEAGDRPLEFTTLLGQHRRLNAAEMRATLRPDVDGLARAIAERILALNPGAPKAVVMVGGGSATPGLGPALAQALGLDPTRVGVRGPETIPELDNPTGALHGVDGVTPLGIALSALRGRGLPFRQVRVNDQPVQLLALHDRPTLFDALLASGGEFKRLFPRPGAALTYTLEGSLRTVPGGLGRPAVLAVNGREATLDTPVAEGDVVLWEDAVDGEDAVLLPESVPRPKGPAWCSCNDRHLDLELVLALDGRPVGPNTSLPDRAKLDWVSVRPLGELVPELATTPDPSPTYVVRVNGQVRNLTEPAVTLTANGRPVDLNYRPRANDRIEWRREARVVTVRDLLGDLKPVHSMTVQVNGRSRTLDYGGARILVNGRAARQDDPVPNEAEVLVEPSPDSVPTLSQVLEGLPLTPPKDGAALKLTIDGQAAGFTTPLRDGAKVEVSFG